MDKEELDKIAVISVKHTGTNFIHQLLLNSVGSVRVTHWSSLDLDNIPSIIISPIRNPGMTYGTWYSRNRFGEQYFQEWEIFNQYFLDGKVTVVPVDTKDRDVHLKSLSNKLGVELSTNWEPVESQKRFSPPMMDLTRVYSLEVVKCFYD